MFCSVLIPSRKRHEKLLRAIDSITYSANGWDYEILVRLDDDDGESIAAMEKAMHGPDGLCNTRLFIGPRLGYSELDIGYYAGLEREAQGQWVWIAGDDMEVTGDWLTALRDVPTHGYIVQPEVSKLGGSVYPRAEGQAFPIFPRFCWKPYSETFPRPFDTAGSDLLLANGWKTWFLPGVCMWHKEGSPEELAEHRKMEAPCI